ncbi:MAG: hypothetical protein ACYCO5_14240 [Acidobacteriaceae bacterium]
MRWSTTRFISRSEMLLSMATAPSEQKTFSSVHRLACRRDRRLPGDASALRYHPSPDTWWGCFAHLLYALVFLDSDLRRQAQGLPSRRHLHGFKIQLGDRPRTYEGLDFLDDLLVDLRRKPLVSASSAEAGRAPSCSSAHRSQTSQ